MKENEKKNKVVDRELTRVDILMFRDRYGKQLNALKRQKNQLETTLTRVNNSLMVVAGKLSALDDIKLTDTEVKHTHPKKKKSKTKIKNKK